MRYQILITGFGGQGAVFLVKVLSIAASLIEQKCIGTENHGMSQRGGSVSCAVKIGEFLSPNIDENSADLLIALEKDEALRYLHYLNQTSGVLVVNGDDKFIDIKNSIKFDAFSYAREGKFDIAGLNVFMLGVVLARVRNFPFTKEIIQSALEQFNSAAASKNISILNKAYKDAQ